MTEVARMRMALLKIAWLLAWLTLAWAPAEGEEPAGHLPGGSFPPRTAPLDVHSAEAARLRLLPRRENSRPGLARPAPPMPGGSLGTVAGALGIVLGLFCVIVWCLRRAAPQGNGPLPKEAVELLGRAPLAGKQQLLLVRVGSKLVLVAASAGHSQTLTEISEPVEVERMLALCRRGQPGSASAAFREVLSELAAEPAAGSLDARPRSGSRGVR